jgi:NosR/NirI family nitrous oxide reductase transcriptional regulator
MTLTKERILDKEPIANGITTRLKAPIRVGLEEHFKETDVKPSRELTKNPKIAALVKNRKFQFFLILPNQIIFWLVIFVGILGASDPNLNFGTAITWFVWFCLVFVLMVVVGRGWCAMCPFGGFAEWIQRKTFWQRTQKALGLGKKVPEPVARLGILLSVFTFLGLTWIEEFFNIAGPGTPSDTSWMVIGIVVTALVFFLVFERRSFCRYFCPLSSIIGTAGAIGSAAGFRTKDREICLECKTKDCMRGGANGFGCPWYTWPGSADTNYYCGLCSECYKACPKDNVGLFVQKPMTSVIAPERRRFDIAWAIAALFGLVLFQQVNALNIYNTWESWLDARTGFPHYPNPILYIGMILAFAAIIGVIIYALSLAFGTPGLQINSASTTFMERMTKFRKFFLPMTYGIIPLVASDYLARQLPKFWLYSPQVIPAFLHVFGLANSHWSLYHDSIISNPNYIVLTQLIVVGLGTLASLYAMMRILNKDLVKISRSPIALRIASVLLVLGFGFFVGVLYFAMHAAT